jgi:AcrR family transcriptional regulator
MTQITDTTRQAILDGAWELMAEEGRLDVSQAEIAKRAGVTRQTIYLAFGSRAGLLLAMVRHRDRKTEHVARIREIATGTGDQPKDLLDFLETWLDYLPIIYPVAIQLDSAKLTDRDAAAAWDSRMKAGLFEGLRMILSRIQAAGGLADGWTVEAAAAWSWTLVHPVQWRLLVIENSWSPEFFKARQIAVARTVLA